MAAGDQSNTLADIAPRAYAMRLLLLRLDKLRDHTQ